jgi:hypothetical protein
MLLHSALKRRNSVEHLLAAAPAGRQVVTATHSAHNGTSVWHRIAT